MNEATRSLGHYLNNVLEMTGELGQVDEEHVNIRVDTKRLQNEFSIHYCSTAYPL